ncbi:MAG: ATP-dependent helicase [Actinomycetia bacterium]|nr:ATP-dependent helicase [Actinomycetes bacterium]
MTVSEAKPAAGDVIPETRVGPDDWSKYVALQDAPQIVVGGPGTGKTQFLVNRVAEAIERGTEPETIVFLAFSRSGTLDIRRRLAAAAGQSAYRVNVATYHGLAMRIVEAHASRLGWETPPTVLTASEQEQFVAAVLADEPATSWPAGYRQLLKSQVMASEVTDFLLRCHEQGVTAADLADSEDARFVAMSGFSARYDAKLTAANRTDYGRILTEANHALDQWPEIAEPYQLVVADEYQDSSPSQAQMLFHLAASSRSLTVAADPYQSIYSFRGTDIANVFSFPTDAREHLGTTATRLVLTTSFRVPEEILKAAVAVTARELPGGAGRVESTRSGGSVAAHTFATLSDEAEWIAADIERVHLIEGVPLERVAVFMRSQSEASTELAAALERRAILHMFTESRLTDEPIVRFIANLVVATGSGDEAHAAIQRVLMSPYIALPYGTVNALSRRAVNGEIWCDIIRHDVPQGASLASLLTDTRWVDDVAAPVGLWHVWSTLIQLVDVALADDKTSDRKAWAAFDQVLSRSVERSPDTTLRSHLALLSGTDYEADPLFSFHPDEASGVTIATLHRAKGTEFDVVYIANAVEGQLPDLRARDSLLGVRLLNPHLPPKTNDYVAFRLDEERRLAYTAMTRATSRVIWTATSNDTTHDGVQPSRFLHLVAPVTPPDRNAQPLTVRSFEARLRQIARDPLASAVERLASIDILAKGADVGLVDALSRYGTKTPGRNSDIRPEPLRLSPSQANDYAVCPRRYAVSRFALSQDHENNYLRFGTLIHQVIEEAERGAVSDGRQRSTRDEAQTRLDALWPEMGFGDDAVGRSWRLRAEDTLENLYTLWPTSGAPVAFESDLRASIAGVDWYGRADRIERRGDDLYIVDYKTSGVPTTKTEAATSIQLGYYLLAARMDEDLSEHGAVAGAEFWYPRARPNKHSIATRSFDIGSLDEVHAELKQITQEILSESFAPVVGKQCDTCVVALVCTARESGKEAFSL